MRAGALTHAIAIPLRTNGAVDGSTEPGRRVDIILSQGALDCADGTSLGREGRSVLLRVVSTNPAPGTFNIAETATNGGAEARVRMLDEDSGPITELAAQTGAVSIESYEVGASAAGGPRVAGSFETRINEVRVSGKFNARLCPEITEEPL